jgi:hypothetical protein
MCIGILCLAESDINLTAPRVKAGKITSKIVIDGLLNDEGWKQATIVQDTFREWWEYNGDSIDPNNTFLIGYDDRYLYVGFMHKQKDVKNIRAQKIDPKENYKTIHNDRVYFDLNTYIFRNEWYVFGVDASGFKHQLYEVETNEKYYMENEIMLDWDASAKVLDTCWSTEMRIPFQSLRYPRKYVDYWRININRNTPELDHNQYSMRYYSWIPVPGGKYSFLDFFGLLEIKDFVGSPKKFDIIPYITSTVDIDSGSKNQPQLMARIGGSGKYYITPDQLIDFTLKPDYSQIEADAPQIDLNNPLALYYPEKRPFFIERQTLFTTPQELFYSRTINDPFAALKYTGNFGRFSAGYISTYDLHTIWVLPFFEQSRIVQSNEKSLVNVGRLKYQLNSGSTIGLITTHRDLMRGCNNRMYGFDALFRIWSNHALTFQGIVTWNQEPDDTTLFRGSSSLNFGDHTATFDGESYRGEGFLVKYGFNDQIWNLSVYYKGLSPEFRADLGFFPTNDWREVGAIGRYYWKIKKGMVETLTPEIDYILTTRFNGESRAITRTAVIQTNLRNQIGFGFTGRLIDKKYQTYEFTNLWSLTGNISTAVGKEITLGADATYGRQIIYYLAPPEIGDNLYPNAWLEVSTGSWNFKGTYSYYQLWQPLADTIFYSQTVLSVEAVWLATNHLNLRFPIQYNTWDHSFYFNPLLTFQPSAFTVIYLGSGHTYNAEDVWNPDSIQFVKSTVFLKLQYQFKL